MVKRLEFKDGSFLEGEIITQALLVLLVKSNGYYYLVSKYALKDSTL